MWIFFIPQERYIHEIFHTTSEATLHFGEVVVNYNPFLFEQGGSSIDVVENI